MKNKLIIALLSMFLSFQMFAQETTENFNEEVMSFYNTIKLYYPANDEIINGTVYYYPNKKIKGTPFFNNEKWNVATLFLKNKAYPSLRLKYDLVNNELIIKYKFNNNVEKLINVNKAHVDSFILGSFLFINSKLILPYTEEITFYNQVYKGNISMYRSYDKRFIDMYDDRFPAGKFSTLSNDLYLLENNELYGISNFNSFLHFFKKEFRNKIKRYLKNNNIEFRDASQSQLENIMKYCNSLIY